MNYEGELTSSVVQYAPRGLRGVNSGGGYLPELISMGRGADDGSQGAYSVY